MIQEMKLLPIEPTSKMKTAAIGEILFDEDTKDYWQLTFEEVTAIYKTMINAYEEKK